MRRDIRNELFTAIILILVLAAVALSALLVSNLTNDGQEIAADATDTPSVVVSNVDESTASETRSEIVVSNTPTETAAVPIVAVTPSPTEPEPTDTETIAPTASDTASPTELEPTDTETTEPTASDTASPTEPEPTDTETTEPTASDTVTATKTPTPTEDTTEAVTPSVTVTPRSTRTTIPTVTSSPTEIASQIPTVTDTNTPSDTPTATSTSTPRRATNARSSRTPTPSATPTVPTVTPTTSPSPTLIPTTADPTLTPTATSTQTPSSTPTLEACAMPPGWTTYRVVRGNTLFAIARATGSTVGELREVNCIADADNIQTNDVLFVPRPPNQPVQTGVPKFPDEAETIALFPVGCGIVASSVSSPHAGQRLSGSFAVFGTATLDDFQYYRLEVRPDFTNVYNFYSRSDVPVSNGVLGQINAELFDDGLFWIRLTVVDTTGNFIQPCEIPVIFE